jgi:hypothetical protein
MTPTPRPSLAIRLVIGVLLTAIALSGCGDGDPPAQVTVGGSSQSGNAALPTLPPIDERNPGQFASDGCAATSSGSDCSVTADQIDEAQAGTGEADWRVLAGFVGPRWTTAVGGSVRILEDTVAVGASATWSATGLVRNEQANAVGAITVRATLLDAGGAEVGTASTEALVPVVRPGEPAPFEIHADVAAGQVASVQWSVTAAPAAEASNRDVELGVLWQRGLADPRPVDLYLYRDPTSGPHPLVVFGSATAVGPSAVTGAAVVGAWLDADGRVIAVAPATVARPEGVALDEDGPARAGEVLPELAGPPAAPRLEPGEAADVLLVLDAADAPPAVDDAQLMLWGMGS